MGSSFAHVNANLGGIAPPARTNQHRFPSAMPMLRGDVAIGTLSVLRPLFGPLSDKQHALLRTFAVIAIESTRLLKELHERTDDLSEFLQQQTATAEVLKVLQPLGLRPAGRARHPGNTCCGKPWRVIECYRRPNPLGVPPRHRASEKVISHEAAGYSGGRRIIGHRRDRELPGPAIAQGIRQLKMVTDWPEGSPGIHSMAVRFAQTVGDATGGRIKIEVFPSGALVRPFETFDAVSAGVADMYHSTEYYWEKKSPAFNFFAAVPFGFTADELFAWVQYGGGQELWDALSGQFNIKSLLCANTGCQMGGWFTSEITSLEEFQGAALPDARPRR